MKKALLSTILLTIMSCLMATNMYDLEYLMNKKQVAVVLKKHNFECVAKKSLVYSSNIGMCDDYEMYTKGEITIELVYELKKLKEWKIYYISQNSEFGFVKLLEHYSVVQGQPDYVPLYPSRIPVSYSEPDPYIFEWEISKTHDALYDIKCFAQETNLDNNTKLVTFHYCSSINGHYLINNVTYDCIVAREKEDIRLKNIMKGELKWWEKVYLGP